MSITDNLPATFGDAKDEVDLEKYPTAKALVQRCAEFFAEVQDLYVASCDLSQTLVLMKTGHQDRILKNILTQTTDPETHTMKILSSMCARASTRRKDGVLQLKSTARNTGDPELAFPSRRRGFSVSLPSI